MIDLLVQFLATTPLLVGLWLMGDRRFGAGLFVVQGRNFWKWRREGARW